MIFISFNHSLLEEYILVSVFLIKLEIKLIYSSRDKKKDFDLEKDDNFL